MGSSYFSQKMRLGWFKYPASFPTDRCKAVPLLQFFYVGGLFFSFFFFFFFFFFFCHYLFLISPSCVLCLLHNLGIFNYIFDIPLVLLKMRQVNEMLRSIFCEDERGNIPQYLLLFIISKLKFSLPISDPL